MLGDSLLVFAECLLETISEGFMMVCFLWSYGEKDWWNIKLSDIFKFH